MKFFPYLFLTIGIGLLIGAGFAYWYSRKFIASAQIANGVVTALNYRTSNQSSGGVYYPQIQFVAQDGKTYTASSNSGSNPAAYDVGEQVKIYYNPNDPTDVLLPDFFSMWGVTAILGFIGTIFTLIGAGIAFAKGKTQAQVY